MKKILILANYLASVFLVKGQEKQYSRTPALGVHAAFFDFTGADTLRSFGQNLKPGLAINFQNNIKKHFEYNITLAGTFLDFANRKNTSLGNGKKQLLLEADASLRVKLLSKTAIFNPYAQLGAGISYFNNYMGVLIPAGIGAQVNLTPDLFILLNSQYRFPITTTQHRHFFHSIGLAGTIHKKRINKTTAPLPELRGFSDRNLRKMRQFYQTYSVEQIWMSITVVLFFNLAAYPA